MKLLHLLSMVSVLVCLGGPDPALGETHGGPGAAAQTQSIAVTAEVAAGAWQGIRLQGLPEGAQLAVRITAERDLSIIVIDEERFHDLPEIRWPLVAINGRGNLRFNVSVPQTGTYYLILDNRSGSFSTRAGVAITASAP